jgi:hypothetical protein
MRTLPLKAFRILPLAFGFFSVALLFSPVLSAQGIAAPQKPLVLSSRMEMGKPVYRMNGRVVEDSAGNSLLKNLERVSQTRGLDAPVFIVIDVRAPFSEAGKLETALDKIGMTHYRLFVTDFTGGKMNEIHWDETGIPIPQN